MFVRAIKTTQVAWEQVFPRDFVIAGSEFSTFKNGVGIGTRKDEQYYPTETKFGSNFCSYTYIPDTYIPFLS